jgi:hypothetical protein
LDGFGVGHGPNRRAQKNQRTNSGILIKDSVFSRRSSSVTGYRFAILQLISQTSLSDMPFL